MSIEVDYSCMVIDDDYIYTELMTQFINEIGFLELKGAYNNPIEAVLEIEKNGTPDLLFLDVEMPQINAFATIDALDPMPTVVVVSSHWQYEEQLRELGVAKFVPKPIKGSEHLETIAKEVLGIE